MSSEEEEKLLRSAVLQNVQTILQVRQRAAQELLETKEALEEETRILELLNRTGQSLAGELDLQVLVQTLTDAGTQLSGAQFGAFFYKMTGAEGARSSPFVYSGAPRDGFEKLGYPHETPLFALT